ncbi:WD repeat-containing protein 75 [Episyrphus balteatus]|uniref:WD repeat-containing protein 75 n=1 Tax=Episyrphus balteatus TaxID=286459 RepID=UPI002486B27A|nr:WD repeat-containing protein 75 [Episyrphus balteatus]
MDENPDKLKLQYLAGGSLVNHAPIFSPDSSLLFVVTDKCIQAYSTKTGLVTHVFEGTKDSLISLEYDLLDENILVACSKSGEVIRWKWVNGRVHSRLQLTFSEVAEYQTFNLMNLHKKGESSYAFVTCTRPKYPVQWFIVNTVDGKLLKPRMEMILKRTKAIVDVSKTYFKYLVIAQGPFLFFVDYEKWTWRKLSNEMKTPVKSVKTHPTELMVMTGDEKGKIMLWRNFFFVNDTVRMTLLHWHHTQITSIVFSPTGSSIFSSGLEAVLVRWNLNDFEQRDYIPRVSSVILQIALASDNSKLAICTADNAIQILGVDFKTQCTIQNFTYTFDDKTKKDKFPIGLRINPRQSTLVLNGRSGHLQFYSAYKKEMLYNVDIVGQNQICYETEKIMYNTRVTQVALNIDWMATAEVFNDEEYLPEVRLKFWYFDVKSMNYLLRTNVGLPHEGGIRAIEFSNPNQVDNLLCATVGFDNIIKIWSIECAYDNITMGIKIWYCSAQTSYKNLPIESIGFSEDGSLLAAGFGNTLCVYKAENLKLLTALVPGGGFDGCVRKAQISVPKVNKNGSKNDSNTMRQKIVQLFSNILRTNDETLLKEIKNSVKTRRIQEIQSIDNSQKQLLYKKIRSMNQLNLFQKLLLYQKLGISFQVSEEWHSKMVDYVQANVPSANMSKNLDKQIPCLNLKTRFKAKYMINKYVKRKQNYDENIANKLAPLLSLIKISNSMPTKPVLTNGFGGGPEESSSNSKVLPPMQSPLLIKKILFCHGDFAHLVIACTENRLLIWNLLNLRLQTVLKLSTEQIAIDPKTNLVSVFTKNQELYVFSPTDALTLYYRQNMPRVLGAVWLPRNHPKSQAFLVNWQSRSILYFLTDNSEIMFLGEDDDVEQNPLTFANESNGPVAKYTPFGTFATNQINNTQNNQITRKAVSMGVHGKAAVKSFLEMSSHTMAPLSLLCNDFLKSVIELNLPSEDKQSKETKSKTLNGHIDSSDDEEDLLGHRTLIEKAGITTKPATESKALSEDYLQKIAAETIEIEF